MRPGVLQDPAPHWLVRQHSGIGYELVLALDVLVLQLAEQPVDGSSLAFLEEQEEKALEVEYMELVRFWLLQVPSLARADEGSRAADASAPEEEEEEEEKDSSDLFLTLHPWPRSSPTPAVACSLLVFFCARSVPFVRWQAEAARHHCRFGPLLQSSSRSSSTMAVACSRLVLLVILHLLLSVPDARHPGLHAPVGHLCCEVVALVAEWKWYVFTGFTCGCSSRCVRFVVGRPAGRWTVTWCGWFCW